MVQNGNYLVHYGVLGQKWGVRRYQNKDGTLTSAGKQRLQNKIDKAANSARYKANDSTKQAEKSEAKAAEIERYGKYHEDVTREYQRLKDNVNNDNYPKNMKDKDKQTLHEYYLRGKELAGESNKSFSVKQLAKDFWYEDEYQKAGIADYLKTKELNRAESARRGAEHYNKIADSLSKLKVDDVISNPSGYKEANKAVKAEIKSQKDKNYDADYKRRVNREVWGD